MIGETALALVALIGAGLFLRSLGETLPVDPGFDADRLMVATMDLGSQGYDEPRSRAFHRRVLERVQAVPGIESATFSSYPPFGGGFLRTTYTEQSDVPDPSKGVLVLTNIVDRNYFPTVGIGLIRGRLFDETDHENVRPTLVINEAMADRFWPGMDPVGQHCRFFNEPGKHEIIGVVRNTKYFALSENPQPCAYFVASQAFSDVVTLNVRAKSDPQALLQSVRAEVQSLDRSLPLTGVATVSQTIRTSLTGRRVGAMLLAVFGGLALVLSAVGIYGVMAYSVSQHTHEIGVRMALGASVQHVIRLVLSQGLKLTALGLGLGILVAAALTRVLSSFLFGVAAMDPLTFGISSILLTIVALAACYIPARRATRVDPMAALRTE